MRTPTRFMNEHLRRTSRRWKHYHDNSTLRPADLYGSQHKPYCRCFGCRPTAPAAPAQQTFEIVGPRSRQSKEDARDRSDAVSAQ